MFRRTYDTIVPKIVDLFYCQALLVQRSDCYQVPGIQFDSEIVQGLLIREYLPRTPQKLTFLVRELVENGVSLGKWYHSTYQQAL